MKGAGRCVLANLSNVLETRFRTVSVSETQEITIVIPLSHTPHTHYVPLSTLTPHYWHIHTPTATLLHTHYKHSTTFHHTPLHFHYTSTTLPLRPHTPNFDCTTLHTTSKLRPHHTAQLSALPTYTKVNLCLSPKLCTVHAYTIHPLSLSPSTKEWKDKLTLTMALGCLWWEKVFCAGHVQAIAEKPRGRGKGRERGKRIECKEGLRIAPVPQRASLYHRLVALWWCVCVYDVRMR